MKAIPGRVALAILLFFLAFLPAGAASKNVDLDGKTTNGSESVVTLTVLQSYPAKVENKITNKAVGDSFTFSWPSAGPGGFSSSATAGTTTGVGAKWVWQTSKTIYSYTGTTCPKDICFTKVAGPDPVTNRGPFSVPGRSLTTSDVTLSSASLTSSIITFFSPPTTLASATSRVEPLGGGLMAYFSQFRNTTSEPITIEIAPTPPGCCPQAHQLNCDGDCVSYLSDPLNCGGCGIACGSEEYCSNGTCVLTCPAGLTACGDQCVDLQSDPLNCGACGTACGDNEICTGGACVECRPPEQTACGNRCVNVHTDPENCGACGVDCNLQCPSTGQGACSQGESCFCLPGSGFASLSLTELVEAPVCETPGATHVIDPGETLVFCAEHPLLPKEADSLLDICGDTIPDGEATCGNGDIASEGTYNKLVPDLTKPIGDVALSPFKVQVTDTTGDGLLKPGESGSLVVALLNVGPVTLTNAQATLTSPPIDLTDDGVSNPVAVTIGVGSSPYGPIEGMPVAATCDTVGSVQLKPGSNTTPFKVSIPSSHPSDTGRPFLLTVTGDVQGTGADFSAAVPFVLGIGGACVPGESTEALDGVVGFASPMAKLVPDGNTVPYPAKPFALGKTRPMKLQLSCSGVALTSSQVGPPEIVGLTRDGVPVDISSINLNDDSNSNDPFFRYSSSQNWHYNMRTRELQRGRYVITVRMANGQDFVSGFVLQ